MAPKFIQRYKESRCDNRIYQRIKTTHKKPEVIVVIPSYKESSKQILQTIASINTNAISFTASVYILINYKETDDYGVKEDALNLFSELNQYKLSANPNIQYSVFIEEMKSKKSGVGLARKILMDTAFLTFLETGDNGIIVNLDADTIVEKNYLNTIKEYFDNRDEIEAANISYSHHLKFSEEKPRPSSRAITNYELHLRYFINMQRWVGLPYAYHTVGSAMAVRSNAYAKEGGMNMRQAGEDFYFLHKYSKNWSLGDLNETTVYPSGRESDRVPFGTGKAITDFERADKKVMTSYNPRSFIALKEWITRIEPLLAESDIGALAQPADQLLKEYLNSNNFHEAVVSIIKNSKPGIARVKKFYNWFDAFRLFKYLHYARDNGRPDLSIDICLGRFFELAAWKDVPKLDSYLDIASKEGDRYLEECLAKMLAHDLGEDYNTQWRAALISRLSRT